MDLLQLCRYYKTRSIFMVAETVDSESVDNRSLAKIKRDEFKKILPASLLDEADTGKMFGMRINWETVTHSEILFWMAQVNRKFGTLTEKPE